MKPQTKAEQIFNNCEFTRNATSAGSEKIELLSVESLDQFRPLAETLKRLARSLHLELGWHYLLDLIWILDQLGEVRGKRIMDAGAGVGLMQWYLAQQGAEVFSVDRSSRAMLPIILRRRFNVQGLREDDLLSIRQALRRVLCDRRARKALLRMFVTARNLMSLSLIESSSGQVWIYNQDLANLADIPGNSLDAVVAVSALEHNTLEGLQQVVAEILRVLKPGGTLLATLNAAKQQDWWHQPSGGWCLTNPTLRQIFQLPAETPDNYERYDQLFQALYGCAELRDNLASFYYRSDQNGMPWGVWNPQYLPVGVCKIKRQESGEDNREP